jgi:hypothetical protein
VHHPGQHLASPGAGIGRFGHRIVARRGLDEPGQQGGLGQGELRRRLVPIRLRRRLDPVRAAPEIDRVEIGVEDLVLGIELLEPVGDHRLADLAGDLALRVEVHLLDELLGDRRAPLQVVALGVVEQGPDGRGQIDAAVLVEALVLRVEHGLDQDRGDGGQLHRQLGLRGPQDGQDRLVIRGVDRGPLVEGGGERRQGGRHRR